LTRRLQDRRQIQIRTLHAVSLFAESQFDDAINTFIELDINPAKVVALYPESIAGRLSIPRKKWFELHGGKPPLRFVQPGSDSLTASPHDNPSVAVVDTPEQQGWSPAQIASGSFRGKLKAGFDRFVPLGSAPKEEDTASLSEKTREKSAGKVIPQVYS
jgi:hypothetical protein